MNLSQRALFAALLGVAVLATGGDAAKADTDDSCGGWADSGECEKNFEWMRDNCATSCGRLHLYEDANKEVQEHAAKDEEILAQVDSFFDLSANDIHGVKVDFEEFRGDVTVVINVASQCGFTDRHYKEMVELWNEHLKPLQDSSRQVRLLAFPCNQFGEQEPGTHEEIHSFVTDTYGVDFMMMEKVDVNGPYASLVYKYLKRMAGPLHIRWNFATYYVITPDGHVIPHTGAAPLDLKTVIFHHATYDEL
eukprot:CAMPEP_0198133576 /NCGR_PEP_ID=MMETSP1442-20131203/59636_1 /TAXON_ID= /ORGANISM="Craspedostauros australis, Strain CCMP3328" /LENGTH=249 /DNA_ID=CAMNT_0043794701 /DNA_START=419 /DNA_END=1168 /DNA_ORIENTATION=-